MKTENSENLPEGDNSSIQGEMIAWENKIEGIARYG